jgi:hypothetical protein
MVAGVKVREFDLSAYAPANSNAIVGIIGAAAKGPVNQRLTFTDEGNLVSAFGRPIDGEHMVCAGIRYLRYGNRLNAIRIAGTLLEYASVSQYKVVSGQNIPIITFKAASAGTWANGQVKINITHNGSPATSYNVYIYFLDKPVQKFINLTNSTIKNVMNASPSYVTVELHEDAGALFPDSTLDPISGVMVPMVLNGGNDGAFASSKSSSSSSGGISARNSWGYTIPANTELEFSRSEGRVIAPGTFTISTATPAESFTDNGLGILTGDDGGTGRINYETGDWTVTFNAAPTANIIVSYKSGTNEIIGSTSSTQLSYSGIISRNGIRPGFFTVLVPRKDQCDIGDGASASYAINLGANIKPGSLSIKALNTSSIEMTATDAVDGTFSGDVAIPGTINYQSGSVAFQFNSNVKNLALIIARYDIFVRDDGTGVLSGSSVIGALNYQTGSWTLVHTFVTLGDYIPGLEDGGSYDAFFRHATVFYGDSTTLEFSGTLEEYPVKLGSLEIYYAVGTSPLVDDGDGNIEGSGGSGSIDYNTGEFSITFIGAPALAYPIQIYSDAIVLHSTSKYPGPIGNERDILSDGLYVWIDKSESSPEDPESSQWYRLRVMFNHGSGTTAIETFDSLKTMKELVETVNDSENGSRYITLEETAFQGEPDVSYDSYVGQKIGMSGAFTLSDVIGTKIEAVSTGLQLFANPELVPLHVATAPGLFHRQIQLAGIEMMEARRGMWIFSIPDLPHSDNAKAFVNGEYNAITPGGSAIPMADVPYPPLASINSDQAMCFYGWLNYYDQYSDKNVWEPPEGDILALMARIDIQFKPWYPMSGIGRGNINVDDLRYSPDEGERERMLGLYGDNIEVVNPIVEFIGDGIYLYGENTMARKATSMDRIHSRWTANLIAAELVRIGRSFVFELNDSILWREISAMVESILRPIKAARGIYDFQVLCDSTTNTADSIAQKKALCKIFLQFAEAAEEIEFQMIYTPTNASFADVAPAG